MPLEAYKIIHIGAVLLIFSAIGGIALHAATGGTRQSNQAFRMIAMTHGIAVLLVVVTGFGMLARLGIARDAMSAGWVWVKLIVWIMLGGVLMIPYRRPHLARPIFFIAPLLGLVAAAMAIYKPF